MFIRILCPSAPEPLSAEQVSQLIESERSWAQYGLVFLPSAPTAPLPAEDVAGPDDEHQRAWATLLNRLTAICREEGIPLNNMPSVGKRLIRLLHEDAEAAQAETFQPAIEELPQVTQVAEDPAPQVSPAIPPLPPTQSDL